VLLLNELEDMRYVSRLRDPGDRRRHLVELTTAGARALGRAEGAQEQIEDEVLHGLDAEERATLWKLLTRALQGAEAVEPATAEAVEPATPEAVEPATTAEAVEPAGAAQ
jgi:DNA-binding PadR family transcriptional regulator